MFLPPTYCDVTVVCDDVLSVLVRSPTQQMLLLAEQYPGLKRGLWWLLAVSVVRHHHGFRRMNLAGVYQVRRGICRSFFGGRT